MPANTRPARAKSTTTGQEDKLRKLVLTTAMALLLATAVAIAGIGAAPPTEATGGLIAAPVQVPSEPAAGPTGDAAGGETAVSVTAPNQLMAGYMGSIGVIVDWEPLEIPSGYKLVIYRDYVSGPGPTERAVVASLPGGDGTWGAVFDRSFTPGATYFYHASVYADASISAAAKSPGYTYHVSIKPHSLSAYPGRNGGVDLRWTPGAHPRFVKQQVLRRPSGSSPWTTIAEIGPRDFKYVDTTAESGTKYSYRIKAAKATGKGGQTNRVKFTAP